MEGSADFLDRLGEALARRAGWLESTQVPRLREILSSYQALFEGVVAMLIRKGLLREDPYNYEQAFTDIVLPSDEVLPEFENSDEVSYRLAAFRRQLKFLTAEYPIDLPSLGLARLKKISALLSYVNWLEFGEGSRSPTTKAFARVFMKVRMGSDSMASQILKDCEVQIVKVTHEIHGLLADLIAYYRESWKAELRRAVFPQVSLSTGEGRMRREEAARAVRRVFGQKMSSKPWYPALAEEVVDEELAEDGPARKERILATLTLPEPEKAMPVSEQDGRAVLLDAVRLITRPHEEIATALAVLEENEKLLHETRPSGGGWLRRLFGGGGHKEKEEERTYKVEYAEPGVPEPKTESIDFPGFLAETRKKASMFGALFAATGPAYRKLESTGEEQMAAFVDRQLNDLLLIHRRMGSLNTVFQARATKEKKTARGIKVELLTIKNSIVKANQRRHEYVESAPAVAG